MIKLVINRFEDSANQSLSIGVETSLKTTGFKEGAKEINDTKLALEGVNKTGININSSSIESANKQLKYTQAFLKTLKANAGTDIAGGLDKLKTSGLFDLLPNATKKLMETMGSAEGIVGDEKDYAEIMQLLGGMSDMFGKINDSVKETENELDEVKDNLEDIDKSENEVSEDSNKIHINWEKIKKSFQQSNGLVANLQKGFKSLNSVRLVSLYHSVKRTTSALVDMVENAADYEESLNLYKMALGTYLDEAAKWMEKITDKLMLDPSDVMKYTGAFFNLTKGLGATSDSAYLMSKNLTQLTYDMASYLNISNEAAQAKIQSAMAGQSRAVASVGVATQISSLQELAYSLNIKKKVSEMTQAEKTYLRYIQLMKSTEHMQGDLGKTMITPANAIRILKNQINLLGRAIGQVLTPFIMKAIPYIMAFTNVLKQAASALAEFFGYKIADVDYDFSINFEDVEDATNALNGLGGAVETAGKKAKNSLAPFDELNQVTSTVGSSGSGSGGVGGSSIFSGEEWEALLPSYDMLKNYTGEIADKAADLEGKVKGIAIAIGGIIAVLKVADAIKWFGDLNKGLEKMTDGSMSLSKHWGQIFTFIAGVAALLAGKAFSKFAGSNILKGDEDDGALQAGIGTGLSSLGGGAMGAAAGSLFGPIGTVVGGVLGALAGGFEGFKTAIDSANEASANFILNGITPVTENIEQMVESLNNGRNSIINNATEVLDSITSYEQWGYQLSQIVDENGKVIEGHEEEANLLVNKLNKALGLNIELKNGQIKGYKKLTEKIEDVIEAKKREVFLNQYEKLWEDSILNQAKYADALAKATENRNKAQQALNNYAGKSPEVIKQLQKAYDEADKIYQEASNTYLQSISDRTTYEKLLVANTKEDYETMSDIISNASDSQYAYTVEGLVKLTKDIKDGEIGNNLLIAWQEMATKDKDAFNTGIEQIADPKIRATILGSIGELGIGMEKKGVTIGNEFADKFLKKLQDKIDKNEINPVIVTDETTGKVGGIYNTISDMFKNNPIKGSVEVDTTGAKKSITKLMSTVSGHKFKVTTKSDGTVSLDAYANGGFPTSGDLFFANENGKSEYIGSIGNKTAVANQDQMAVVITNAVIAGFNKLQPQTQNSGPNNIEVYIGNDKVYQGQGQYQSRQTDRYGTSYVKI